MTDFIIWCCVFLAVGLWLGFMLCMILTFGGVRKWKVCKDTYQSGRVTVLHELYERIAERQKEAKGDAWGALNEVLDLIAGMLPEKIGEG